MQPTEGGGTTVNMIAWFHEKEVLHSMFHYLNNCLNFEEVMNDDAHFNCEILYAMIAIDDLSELVLLISCAY